VCRRFGIFPRSSRLLRQPLFGYAPWLSDRWRSVCCRSLSGCTLLHHGRARNVNGFFGVMTMIIAVRRVSKSSTGCSHVTAAASGSPFRSCVNRFMVTFVSAHDRRVDGRASARLQLAQQPVPDSAVHMSHRRHGVRLMAGYILVPPGIRLQARRTLGQSFVLVLADRLPIPLFMPLYALGLMA